MMERLFDLIETQSRERPNDIMLASKVNGSWQTHSCLSVAETAMSFANGLLTLGIKNDILEPEQQEKIAIVSTNRPEWIIADAAVQQTGAILTPIYPTISPQEFAFILNQAEVSILIVSDKQLYERFKPAFKDIPTLKHVFSFDKIEGVQHWKDLKGTQESNQKRLEVRNRITGNRLATIIYTSGTTGTPKGVMLSHENIVSNVIDCMPVFHFAVVGDKALSFLPLNHIFEKTVTYIYINSGISIYYAESFDTIGDNLKEVRPMVFTCVPRVMEKVYEKIMATGRGLSGIKKSLFFWAIALGKQYDTQEQGSLWYRIQLSIANKLIFNKWREALGGRVRAIVSGSAPLPDYLNRVFCAGQIPIMEGYGLTETSPVVSVNRLEEKDRLVGSIGPLIDNVEVKIAADGEILCRGKNIMVGYYKSPEKTAEVIDKDGWFYTGDIGEFVDGRFLKITDRKKEMFKTSGGKYVAPQPIENKFKESRYIEQMMIVGPSRKFVSALIVPNFEQVYKYVKELDPSASDQAEALIKHPETDKLFNGVLDRYNPNFNHVEQVKKFVLLPQEWTIESGILTPKLSLKRKVVFERFAKEINSMYE